MPSFIQKYKKKIIIAAVIVLVLVIFYILGALSVGKDINYIPI